VIEVEFYGECIRCGMASIRGGRAESLEQLREWLELIPWVCSCGGVIVQADEAD
jgi:hypothetical protein